VTSEALKPWERRRQVERVLNPRGDIRYAGLKFAVDMAVRYEWNIEPVASGKQRASQKSRTVWTPPICGEAELAVFAHEGGHVQDPDSDGRRFVAVQGKDGERWAESLEAELAAWQWAMARLARTWWGKIAQITMERCLSTYQRGNVKTAAQLTIFESVLKEGAFLAGGAVPLRPRPSVDLTRLREFHEGDARTADIQRVCDIMRRL